MPKVTLKDIARAANVSAMTVSKAINNKPGISKERREYILRIAKKMNYTPNMIAKSLRSDKSGTLGVVLSDSSSMVTSRILRGIQDCADKHSYSVIVANTDHNPEREQDAVSSLLSKQIDGLILVAPVLSSYEELSHIKSWGVPFILLMRKNDKFNVDTVVNDNYLGGYQSVEHLIKEGCERFQFLALENSQSSAAREEGYIQALKDYQIPASSYRFEYVKPYIAEGRRAALQLLASDFKFDGLICGCDTVAIGAMDALLENNIRIPEDIKLIGYDGIPLAQYLRVPLSTIEQPLYDIGYTGSDILFERILYPDIAVRKIVLKSSLVIRDSSRHPVE